jgi:hypothetical protein
VKTPVASDRLVVRVRGTQCGGAPTMRVRVDGVLVFATAVSSTSFRDYGPSVKVPAGEHTVSVALVNDYRTSCVTEIFISTELR